MPNEHWNIMLTTAAQKDMDKLREPCKTHVVRALKKVSINPLPASEGGYGKSLGNKDGYDLAELLKIKLRGDDVRIVYRLKREGHIMKIIVIGIRNDNAVHREAFRRLHK